MPRFLPHVLSSAPAFLLLAGLFVPANPALADTLLIERQERAAEVARPAKGMLMAQVERDFGAPEGKSEPVGSPPITKWTYPGYTVYFEHDHVITTVLNKASVREQGPKPAQ